MKKTRNKVSTGGVSSSHWVFDVLRMVIDAPDPVGVGDISRKLGIPPTTAQRGLLTLEHAGYIQLYGTGNRYVVGDQPKRLLLGFLGRFPLRSVIIPYLTQFSLRVRETVVLWVPIGWNAVAIGASEGLGEVFTRVPLGKVRPFYGSAVGEIFLSYRTDEDLASYEANMNTGRNPAESLSALHSRLRKTLRLGHTLQAQDHNASLALPVRVENVAVGCVSIEGSSDSLMTRQEDFLQIVQPILSDIERLLSRKPELYINPYKHIPSQNIDLDHLLDR